VVIPASSTEYVHVPVIAPVGVDLTGSAPRLAILPVTNRDNPTAGNWHTGEWADDGSARLLVGPDGGAITLDKGDYRVYVSFDPPGSENVVRLSGYLGVT
jgi:hypothetical protein